MDDYTPYITEKAGKRSGQLCIRNLRIILSDVLSSLATGMSETEVHQDFPMLTPMQMRVVNAYATEKCREV